MLASSLVSTVNYCVVSGWLNDILTSAPPRAHSLPLSPSILFVVNGTGRILEHSRNSRNNRLLKSTKHTMKIQPP